MIYSNLKNSEKSNVQGFTLLEVLITLIITSIGLLGLAALQLTSLQENHRAYVRTEAVLLARDLADRMRSNRSAARAGVFVNSDPASAPDDPGFSCRAVSQPSGEVCSSTQLAQADLYDWYTRVDPDVNADAGSVRPAWLPLGQAAVTCPSGCGAGLPHRIVLQWDENRDGVVTYDAGNPTSPGNDPRMVVEFVP